MSLQKNNIIYTAEDIQKYLSGKLSSAEMHAMEKAALDDPFLADAIEGYAGLDEKDWDKQPALLKANFSKKQTTKIVPLKSSQRTNFWKVAAAILIVFGGVATTYLLTNKEANKDKSIAAINKNQDSAKTLSETVKADTDFKLSFPDNAKNKTKAINRPLAVNKGQQPLADSNFIYRPGAPPKKEAEQVAGGGYADNRVKSSKDIATINAASPARQNNIEQNETSNKVSEREVAGSDDLKKSAPVVIRKFMAQIVDKDGAPLPFSNISIPDKGIGTYADVKGNIRLVSADSILNIEVKSVGYITRNFKLKSDVPQNKIVLTEDELVLKEKIVVTGKAPGTAFTRRRSIFVPDSVIDVEPEDGWNNYDIYVTNNLSFSDDPVQKKIHGEVEVSFDVQGNGAITNMKIDRSLCSDCDEAALRVIRDGPRWKVKKGSQGNAKVKVKF